MRGWCKWLEMQNNSRESLTHISPGKYLMRAPRRGEQSSREWVEQRYFIKCDVFRPVISPSQVENVVKRSVTRLPCKSSRETQKYDPIDPLFSFSFFLILFLFIYFFLYILYIIYILYPLYILQYICVRQFIIDREIARMNTYLDGGGDVNLMIYR